MKKAVVYARFSSNNQREESIEAQVRGCTEFVSRQGGLIIVKNYIDRGTSATSDRRPEFQAMIEDSGKKMFDVVIVHKLDRFARNRYDSAKYKQKLKKNGISLISVTEHLDNSPESVVLESVLEGMAEYYSKNLAREVMKGMRETAYQCKHTGGIPPLGYDVDPITKRYVLNEAEAETVKLIFEMYLCGMGYNKMVGELAFRGLKTKNGKPFGKGSLHDILRNEKYAGIYVFNRAAAKDAEGQRNNHASKDAESQIKIPGGVPAIVDEDTFRKAQSKMKENQRQSASYKAKETYLLSGLIYCGECLERDGKDVLMMGNSKYSGQGKNKHVTYRCGQRHRTHSCDNRELRREYVEEFVLKELERRVFSGRAIPKLAEQLNNYQQQSLAGREAESEPLTRELREIDRQINNIVQAVSEGFSQSSMVGKLAELEERKAQVESRLQENRNKLQREPVTEEAVRKLLGRFREFVRARDIPEIKKFINSFVKKVIVSKGHVVVVFLFAQYALFHNDGMSFSVNVSRGKLCGKAGSAA